MIKQRGIGVADGGRSVGSGMVAIGVMFWLSAASCGGGGARGAFTEEEDSSPFLPDAGETATTFPADRLVSSSNRYADAARLPLLVGQLESATDGLLFTSESDYPFEVVYWTHPGGQPSAARVAAFAGEEGAALVATEEKTVEEFFRAAATVRPDQTPEEVATARRYQALVRLLRRKLSFIRAYRFGRIQIHSYVVGVTSSGAWAGLSTIQIET